MMKNDDNAIFLTIKSAARKVGISELSLRRLVHQGKIPGFYTGHRFMVNVPMLVEMFNTLEGLSSLSDKKV